MSNLTFPKKILILEDEVLIAKFLGHKLKQAGHETTNFTKVKDAIHHVIENPQAFDYFICDLMLQDSTGLEFIEFLNKSIVKESPIQICDRVLLITAYTSHAIIERVKSYNIHIIFKPFQNFNEGLHWINEKELKNNDKNKNSTLPAT